MIYSHTNPMTDLQPRAPSDQQILASWQASVLPRHERSQRWYAIGGAVVLIGAAYGIFTGSWPFTVVVILCGAMYYLTRDHIPPLKTITILNTGVLLEQTFTRWEELSGFWILQAPEYTELHFVPLQKRRSDIVIQTNNQNINDLRLLIGQYISELTDKRESLLDTFIRLIKL